MIKFLGDEQDQITFVTRAVRVVDLITNLDMAAFQSHSGLSIFIYRLEVAPPRGLFEGKKGFLSFSWLFHALLAPQHEVDLCRRECPFVIKPKVQRPATAALPEGEEMETDMEGEKKGGTKTGTGVGRTPKSPLPP